MILSYLRYGGFRFFFTESVNYLLFLFYKFQKQLGG